MSRNGNSKNRDEKLHTGSPAEQVLAHAQAGREVVQEFVPLASSLEWILGQEYLRQRGNKAFLSDAAPVPFLVNNEGTLSKNAADVFFASLRDAEERGVLEDEIVVLELGIGVGLFARYFLDHLRTLCRQHKKDYYERLTYIAADRSPRMLHDVLRHGVLAEHPGRYRVRQIDAMEPEAVLRDVGFLSSAGAAVRDVLDNSGNVKDAITYDGWGNILSGETNPAYRGNYAWTGRMLDVETGLQYNRARWYDPTTGRWQTQDPLGFGAGDSNLYRYVNNKPTITADPSGLSQVALGYPQVVIPGGDGRADLILPANPPPTPVPVAPPLFPPGPHLKPIFPWSGLALSQVNDPLDPFGESWISIAAVTTERLKNNQNAVVTTVSGNFFVCPPDGYLYVKGSITNTAGPPPNQLMGGGANITGPAVGGNGSGTYILTFTGPGVKGTFNIVVDLVVAEKNFSRTYAARLNKFPLAPPPP